MTAEQIKHSNTPRKISVWILLFLYSGAFAFLAYHWFSYCPPNAAVAFTFSGDWLQNTFDPRNAGLALDRPSIGKFFLWTSVLSCLACTIALLVYTIADSDRRVIRWCVVASTTLLFSLILIWLLMPTFLLIQYILSMGMTMRRLLGVCLCFGFWISLPCTIFWIRKAKSSLMDLIREPLIWALLCSLVAPTYYSLPLHWTTESVVFLMAWMLLVISALFAMWLTAQAGNKIAQ